MNRHKGTQTEETQTHRKNDFVLSNVIHTTVNSKAKPYVKMRSMLLYFNVTLLDRVSAVPCLLM